MSTGRNKRKNVGNLPADFKRVKARVGKKAEKASKTSAQPSKQRLAKAYVSRQLAQLHRGGCVVTAMRPYHMPTVKLR